MKFQTLLVILIVGIGLVACQSDDKAPSSSRSVTKQEAVQAKKQLEDLGIEITDMEFLKRVTKGDTETVELLLKAGISPNAKNINGVTGLMFAADWGRVETTKLLIEYGADLNTQEFNKSYALERAADSRMPGAAETALTLIQAGADVNIVGQEGTTPLMRAVTSEKIEVIKALIHAGADLDFRGGYREKTALELAEERWNHEITKILSEAEAQKK